jgi:cobalt-zinc-cadmium efflux system membrane fusion protein
VARVAAPIEGRVATIHVKVGDKVKAGDPLVTLQSPAAAAIRAELDSASVAHGAAQTSLERQDSMLQKGVGIESERFQAEVDLRKSQADLARSERAAAYLGAGSGSTVVVRAPIDGTVIQRTATIGAVADPNGEALIELGDPSALWVVADVFERDLPLIKSGSDVSVEVSASTTPVHARVASVGSALNDGMRTAPVYVSLDDQVPALRAGMFARATITSDSQKGVDLPVTAVLIKDGKRSVVYVERTDGAFVPRDVTVAQPIEGHVQVLAGLDDGERVVVEGALLLDGAAEQLL